MPHAASPETLGAALEPWRGAPYLLGGTRTTGVDCSGLVQRVLRSALGVLVPRHSTDQRAWTEASCDAQPAHGDLIFVWTDAEAPCHVGITRLEGGSLRVVHASQSRMRVVSDGFDEFAHDARRLERVPIASVVSAYSRFVGASSIELTGENDP
jgi:cell wall-associated NlpC family hydrolase